MCHIDQGRFLTDLYVPVTSHGGLPGADIGVTSQHFEGRRLSGSINSQKTKALTGQKRIRLSMRGHILLKYWRQSAETHSLLQPIDIPLKL